MVSLLLLGCADSYQSGASEPITVRDGSFHAGELPGDEGTSTPSILYVASVGYLITQGQANIGYSGLTSPDAYSVAVAFPDIGSGYWVVPVDGPDVTQDNNLLFNLTADFSRDVPYGLTSLSFVALDGDGNPGPQTDAKLCVLPDFSDNNYAACSEDAPPQHTVLSLSWSTDVDLDLVVVTPAGQVVRSESPSTAIDEDDESEVGVLTRDSNSHCAIDSIRLESLVFEEAPPEGDYAVYASLFSPCGQASSYFDLALHQRVDEADGTWSIESTALADGVVFAAQADAGASLGTYVTTVTLP